MNKTGFRMLFSGMLGLTIMSDKRKLKKAKKKKLKESKKLKKQKGLRLFLLVAINTYPIMRENKILYLQEDYYVSRDYVCISFIGIVYRQNKVYKALFFRT